MEGGEQRGMRGGAGGGVRGSERGGEFGSEEQLPKPVRWRRVRSAEIRRQPASGS